MGEDSDIKRCLGLIEERLGWGTSTSWVNYDFERLAAAIEEKTGVLLSITTLKRIWGKVKYDSSPTLTTLNTLARFLDFEDWRSFTKQHAALQTPLQPEVETTPRTEEISQAGKKRKITIPVSLLTAVFLLSLTFLIFSARKRSIAMQLDAGEYQFKADKIISQGVPNSVIFSYDASASPTDSVYIVQTWDARRKTLVSRSNQKHSAIYYYPGFFRTKLIVGNTVVKTHDLQISTDGWLCLMEADPIPFYFKKEEYRKNDRVEIDRNLLKKYNLGLNPVAPKIRFFNQRDLGDLMDDDFLFETTVKNAFNEGSNSCQYVEILIQCKDDIIIIPLSAKACAGNLSLYAAGKQLNSREADLSGFGADLNQWTTLRVESKEKNMRFYVNNILAASLAFPNNPTGIVGVQYRFNGTGAARNTWFENGSGRISLD
jgi:hypothetical protein